jgi:MerR family transcriptional regulator, thiopeptide resistance regulator
VPSAAGVVVMPGGETTMAYTVKQVARMSGVSVRALHFYDETGLLKPAYYAANGYRFYEEAQLLTLQQILFYRELGFELKQIKKILGRADFEKIAALESHRKVLRKNLARQRKLLETIDKTIEHLKGKKKMKSQELFVGFDPKVQAKHEQYLIDRYGEGMKAGIEESKKKVKNWTKADWQKSGDAFNGICRDLVAAIERKLPAESPDVQKVIRRHYTWLKQFWTPTRESYAGHSQMIADSDLRKAYEAHDPQLPEFVAAAMRSFAERALK